MAYDAATGTVVVFGGYGGSGDTWTWNGTTWTKQSPAASPLDGDGAPMVYDAATKNVVLFGGFGMLRDTWVWDGSTWTKQHPAVRPPGRIDASMVYDAATGTVVLFGGQGSHRPLHDTWVWDGSTWTKQHPATSPPGLYQASMAYDAATRNVVLFGGLTGLRTHDLGGTWVWDGSTWTKQSPTATPDPRHGASIAYDAATKSVVLFGGYSLPGGGRTNDTWMWDGSTWTAQTPATSPPPRFLASMAYDAATKNLVLFGGSPADPTTWTYGSS